MATALAGGVLCSLQLVRSLSLPKLRENAKGIMSRLLSSGGIQPSVVRTYRSIYLNVVLPGKPHVCL